MRQPPALLYSTLRTTQKLFDKHRGLRYGRVINNSKPTFIRLLVEFKGVGAFAADGNGRRRSVHGKQHAHNNGASLHHYLPGAGGHDEDSVNPFLVGGPCYLH